MVSDCYVLQAKVLKSASRIFEDSYGLDLVPDRDEENHDQSKVDAIYALRVVLFSIPM